MSAWPNLDGVCRSLGFHGIGPDSLEQVEKIAHYLNEETRSEFDHFMKKARVFFADPREDHEDA